MIVALLVTAAAVIAGGGLAVVTSRDNVLVGGLQSFGAAAVVAAVVVQLLPEAVAGIGSWALVAFIGALAAPMFVAALSTKLRRASLFGQQNFGAELAFYGFVVHQWAEGVALGTVTAQEHGHSHLDLVIGIAAHTVPITAVFVAAALASRGRRSAALRTATLLAATLAGFVTVALFEGQSLQTIQPWVSAAAAGFLVHVLLHAPERNSGRGSVAGSVDVLGLALGATLPFIVGHAHSAKGDIVVQVRADLGVAFVDLMLATAPMLLLGLVLGAVVQLFGSRIPTRFFTERGPVRQALRGIAVGTPLPLCACTLLPVAESLRRRGGGPAVVTAFLTATPAMGPEMVTLTVLLFGGTFTLVRFGAALLLAFLCAVVLALLAGRPELASPSSAPSVDPLAQLGERAEPPPTLTRVYGFFDALLLHTGPWMLVGLVAAAYVRVVVPAGAFAEAAGYGLDAVIIGVLALPAYVCAVAATPLAAVALLKGVSPGAVLIGLLLGPAMNLGTIEVLRRAYKPRAVAAAVLAIVAAAFAVGFAANAVALPVTVPAELFGVTSGRWLGVLAASALGLALVSQVWRWGLRPWLEILDPGHKHGHDHDHDHDKCRAHEHEH